MNDHEQSKPDSGCAHTDAVLAVFLDGATIEEDARLTEHRDSCPYCRQALERTRALDALLASQTRTDIDESVADRVLAFDAPLPSRTNAPGLLLRLLAVAALLVAGALIWTVVRSRPIDPAPRRATARTEPTTVPTTEPKRPVERPAPTGPRVIEAPSTLKLASGARLRWRSAPVELDHDTLLARFDYGATNADERRALVRRAVHVASVDAADVPPDVRVAAVRWLAGEVERGRLAPRRLWSAAELLVQSKGPLRRELVAVFREQRALRNLLGRTLPSRHAVWGARDRLVADAIAATGMHDRLDRVRSAPDDVVERAVAMARATGDRAAVEFAVDLCCDVVARGAVPGEQVTAWFTSAGSDETWLVAALDERMRLARRRPTRELCRAILDARLPPDSGVL